jgi:NAD(P)-dependent dehydrogenase (short-subunit alcohol dehydrogenase family)
VQGRLALIVGGAVVAGAAAYRALVRRGPAPVVPAPHAEALKTKLAEARVAADDREEFEAAETPIDEAETVPGEVGDRRRTVHERGRQVAEQMRRGSSSGE